MKLLLPEQAEASLNKIQWKEHRSEQTDHPGKTEARGAGGIVLGWVAEVGC
jgi:hypothetical protein